MSKKSQNLVVWMYLTQKAYETSLKAGKMILNRFCIDEDAAFELSGVNYLKKYKLISSEGEWKEKGKDCKFPQHNIVRFFTANGNL